MSDPVAIAWLDLETTCSDENEDHAAILEVGLHVTNYYLESVAATSVVLNPGYDVNTKDDGAATREAWLDNIWAAMDPFVQDMHTKNGLWDEVVKSDWSTERADEALADFLKKIGEGKKVAFAGSGVGHFDSRWVKKFLPRTYKKLTYWTFDVGVMRRFLRDLAKVDVEAADTRGVSGGDAKVHRALDDAKAHLDEARVYVDSLRGHVL